MSSGSHDVSCIFLCPIRLLEVVYLKIPVIQNCNLAIRESVEAVFSTKPGSKPMMFVTVPIQNTTVIVLYRYFQSLADHHPNRVDKPAICFADPISKPLLQSPNFRLCYIRV
jgi:hypothetical protein